MLIFHIFMFLVSLCEVLSHFNIVYVRSTCWGWCPNIVTSYFWGVPWDGDWDWLDGKWVKSNTLSSKNVFALLILVAQQLKYLGMMRPRNWFHPLNQIKLKPCFSLFFCIQKTLYVFKNVSSPNKGAKPSFSVHWG